MTDVDPRRARDTDGILRAPTRIRTLTLLAASCAALLAGGCGGGESDNAGDQPAAAQQRAMLNGADTPSREDFPVPSKGQSLQAFADSIGATGTQIGLATTVFTPGENRLAFGVLNDKNAFVYAPSAVYVARSPGSRRVLGPYLAPADLLVTETAFRSQQAATEGDPFAAVYQADAVALASPGTWTVLVVSKVTGRLVAAPAQITVRKDSPIPAVGERAPAIETDTVASAGSIEAVDTRLPPARDLHDTSLKDVLGKKPVALLFATPQLCQSRTCGPVVDIALQLREKFGERVQFIHQEVFVDNEVGKGLREPLRRFGLQTEPWLFAIGADGRVAARLEGSFGLRAFERALQTALDRG